MEGQFFPNEDEIFDLLMQELPRGVYATDKAVNPDTSKRSYSSSELRAHALIFNDIYNNLAIIAADKNASTVTEGGIARWEAEYFTEAQDASQPFSVRKENLLIKLQASDGINYESVRKAVANILDPQSIPFRLLAYCGVSQGDETGAWILEISSLGFDTYLAGLDPLRGAGRGAGIIPLGCDRDYAAAGLTEEEMREIEETAYKYELRIYGNASADTLARLESILTEREPARSDHVILNNATPPNP